jgi:hypothetical protein
MRRLLLLAGFLTGISLSLFSQAHIDSTFNAIIRQPNGGWIAGDATFSISLPDSTTLWLFGDSFIGTVNADSSIMPGASMIRNSAMLQDGDSTRVIFGGTFQQPENFVSTLTPDSTWFWPEHGLVENDTLKIFLSEFKLAPGPSGFNFKYNAAYIGRFTYPGIQLIDLLKLPYYDLNGVCYGNQVLTENGYTYIYGRKEVNPQYQISYPHLARAVVGNITGPWEFFTGISWVTNPAGTQRIISQEVSQQYGVAKKGSKYIIINQEIWLSTKIYAFVADQPYGQWNKKTLVYETPLLYPNTFTYNAFPHPQFNTADELLVSYNTNGNFADIFKNVEVYRPRFIRVPFQMIDSTLLSGVENFQKATKPADVILYQNYPNPASESTTINFTVNKRSFVSLKLNDVYGKEIRSYLNKVMLPGDYSVDIDLQRLKTGLYSYQINDKSFKLIKSP